MAGTFELQNAAAEPGHRLTVRLADRGSGVEVENTGPATAFDLTLRTADGKTSVTKRALALEDGHAMTVRPADWSAENIGRAPVRVDSAGPPAGAGRAPSMPERTSSMPRQVTARRGVFSCPAVPLAPASRLR